MKDATTHDTTFFFARLCACAYEFVVCLCCAMIVTGLLKNVRYMDEDSLHRRSLEQEPIHSLNDSVGTIDRTRTRPHTRTAHTAKHSYTRNVTNVYYLAVIADDENKPAEVVVKNPLVALKAISKDFKAVSASEEVLIPASLSF
jgi:hypothetical protein